MRDYLRAEVIAQERADADLAAARASRQLHDAREQRRAYELGMEAFRARLAGLSAELDEICAEEGQDAGLFFQHLQWWWEERVDIVWRHPDAPSERAFAAVVELVEEVWDRGPDWARGAVLSGWIIDQPDRTAAALPSLLRAEWDRGYPSDRPGPPWSDDPPRRTDGAVT
jgi:hypothetical protein